MTGLEFNRKQAYFVLEKRRNTHALKLVNNKIKKFKTLAATMTDIQNTINTHVEKIKYTDQLNNTTYVCKEQVNYDI